MLSTVVNGKTVKVGDEYTATVNAASSEICPSGTKVVVNCIVRKADMRVLIGLLSVDKGVVGWHSLDDRVPPHHGYWASRQCLADNFEPANVQYVVNADFTYKGRNLKGMKCRILNMGRTFPDVTFVEMEENVGGGSADGRGKLGHCVIADTRSLKRHKIEPKTKKGAK
jgi:hypothetical protein